MYKLRREFWGEMGVPLRRTLRKDRVKLLLEGSYLRSTQKFTFAINGRVVCERGFLILLGAT